MVERGCGIGRSWTADKFWQSNNLFLKNLQPSNIVGLVVCVWGFEEGPKGLRAVGAVKIASSYHRLRGLIIDSVDILVSLCGNVCLRLYTSVSVCLRVGFRVGVPLKICVVGVRVGFLVEHKGLHLFE